MCSPKAKAFLCSNASVSVSNGSPQCCSVHLAVSLSAPEDGAEPELMVECTYYDPFPEFPDWLSNPSQVAPTELTSPPVQACASLCEATDWPM